MARMKFNGYSITELRAIAREQGIKGRSTMDGHALHAAVTARWTADREAAEQAVIGAATVGAVLRHKSSGHTIRVIGDVYTWEPYGALCVPAEYVEVEGYWAAGRGADYAAYLNDANTHRTDGGPHHPLWQYEAVQAA